MLRAAYVQVWQSGTYGERAERQHTTSQAIPAPRGPILDADGTVLVESRPLVELAVAPKEVRASDRPRLVRALRNAEVPPATISKATDTTLKWVPVPGRFLSADVASLISIRGVHTEPTLERVPSPLPGLTGIIGHADPDGEGLDGIELALDSLLRGVPGRAAWVRDGRGSRLVSPEVRGVAATQGYSVTLTLRLDLQDIAEHALSDAVKSTKALGGDVVVLDPRSGDVLALASRRSDPRATTATALTEPVEPGSTLKPFVAAALLERKRVRLDEVFETYNGVWSLHGVKLFDVHRAPRMTFSQVIEYSSNIGMAQAAQRLTPQEEYEILRDFGFGASTGLPFPSEASGVLRDPRSWSGMSQASLARGYEMMATPVQLAVAYAAIANGGELLEPALVKEIRNARGQPVYQHQRTVVRRVISSDIAHTMRNVLRLVVDSGTATRAELATFDVGGKSGTAKRTVKGKYVPGDYTATFVGLFPADDPQLVVLVKLDSPDAADAYFGGVIAAPVMKAVLEAALASRDAALDRARLSARQRPSTRLAANAVQAAAETEPVTDAADDSSSIPFVLTLSTAGRGQTTSVLGARAVPDVHDLSLRSAVSILHRAGFRVRVVGTGANEHAGGTSPAAGSTAQPGTLVTLQHGS
ncbi:MAG TPA: penicillin-binding transpeptidase domain-containing protein [Gemmatimonadaceae bacterium]|nr:penicillin-binding transpeptidase domain-containing protein [Gemmatimonadaceae bacterium]